MVKRPATFSARLAAIRKRFPAAKDQTPYLEHLALTLTLTDVAIFLARVEGWWG